MLIVKIPREESEGEGMSDNNSVESKVKVKGMKVFIDQRGHRGKTQRKRKKSHFVSFAGIWNK